MKRTTLLLTTFLAITSLGSARVNQSDSQTLQAILSELRQIRSELHNQQGQSQTLQVLLFQMEQTLKAGVSVARRQQGQFEPAVRVEYEEVKCLVVISKWIESGRLAMGGFTLIERLVDT
jgi:hypothetical protein